MSHDDLPPLKKLKPVMGRMRDMREMEPIDFDKDEEELFSDEPCHDCGEDTCVCLEPY